MDINLDEVKDIDLTSLKEEFIRGPIREEKNSFGYRGSVSWFASKRTL